MNFILLIKKNKLRFEQDSGKKKNTKINRALLAIYDDTDSVDKNYLKKFNSNYGEAKILDMPTKKIYSNKLYGSGNENIVAFLIAESKQKKKNKYII